MNKSYSVHAPLETCTSYVHQSVFYDLEEGHDNWEKIKLFGLSCLSGRVPTFEVITEQGYVFSDIPVHLIMWKKPTSEQLEIQELVYNNCLSENFVLTQFPELLNRNAFVFFKRLDKYMKGSYYFSLDFYEKNNWYHCIKLENGQFCFMPSHKIVFNNLIPENHIFPAYKKLRKEFKV